MDSPELEANAFNTSVAEKVVNPAVREMFHELAKDEMGHYEQIKAFRAGPTASMKIPVPSRDSKPAETADTPRRSRPAVTGGASVVPVVGDRREDPVRHLAS